MAQASSGTKSAQSVWGRICLVAIGLSVIFVLAGLIWAALDFAGTPDPTAPGAARHMSGGAVIIGAGILVFPAWMGTWFSLVANWETLAAMALSAVFVIGSYYLANYLKVSRPRHQGERPAIRPTVAPAHEA